MDCSLLLILLGVLSTAGVAFFVFPAPSQAQGWTLWGQSYDTWLRVHGLLLGLFALDVLLHLILHWTWICGYITHRLPRATGKPAVLPDGIKTLYGVGTLIMVLTLVSFLIAWAQFAIHQPGA